MKPRLEVGVDDAGGLRRPGAALDGPGAALVLAGGEEGDEVEDLVRGARDRVQARLLQPEALEKRGPIGRRRARRSRASAAAQITTTGAPSASAWAAQSARRSLSSSARRELLLGDVRDVEDLLQRQQPRSRTQRLLLGGRAPGRAPACPRRGPRAGARRSRAICFSSLARGALERLLRALDALVDGLEVLEAELGVDGADVGDRIDAALDVDDVVVLEAADDVRDRVGLADVREELVAEALALGCAAHEAGDVDEVDRRGDDRFGWSSATSASSRASGTGTTPTFGSIVQKG